MTFKAILNNLGSIGGFGMADTPTRIPYVGIDRYHRGGHHHHYESSGHKGKGGGGSGAALSALTLLAFLFLINVMQQSLNENNSTMPTQMTTVVLRAEDNPIVLDTREKSEFDAKEEDKIQITTSYGKPPPTMLKITDRRP